MEPGWQTEAKLERYISPLQALGEYILSASFKSEEVIMTACHLEQNRNICHVTFVFYITIGGVVTLNLRKRLGCVMNLHANL